MALAMGENSAGVADPPIRGPVRMNPAWVALVEIVDRIEQEPYHWPVGRTMFQKIAYFATELGLPTGLHFSRGSYGPFASELKPLISRLVDNGVLREEMIGRMFAVRPGPTFREARGSYRRQIQQWDAIIERVADLFLRLKTQDAEIAATVHCAAQGLAKGTNTRPTEMDIFEEVNRWKQRRRPPLDDLEIADTIRNLSALCWLDVRASPELPLSEDALLNV